MGLLSSLLGGMSGKGGMGGAGGAPELKVPDAKSLLGNTGGGLGGMLKSALTGAGPGQGMSGVPGSGPDAKLPPPAAAMRGPMGNGGPSGGMTPGPQGPNMTMPGVGQSLGGKPMPSPIKEAAGSMGMLNPQSNSMSGMMGAQPPMPQQGMMGGGNPQPQSTGPLGKLMTPETPKQEPGTLPPQINSLLSKGMEQSTPGLEKLAASFNPISSAQGAPDSAGGYQLGQTSAKYESAKKGVLAMNPEALGKKGVDARGGPSYGQYQLAAGPGTLQTYIKQSPYAKEFGGLKPGTPAFNTKWTELAKDPAFGKSQHDFIQKTHFDPVRQYADKAGLANNPGVNDALWSMGVQHGPGGAKSLVSAAGIKPGDSPQTQVNKLYAARESKFPKFESRYNAELKDSLALAKGNNTMMASNNTNPAVTKLQEAGYKPNVERINRTGTTNNPLDAASKYLGTNEHEGAPVLQSVFKKAGINIDPSKTPWCAAFVDATLKEGGMKGTGSLMAKSYLDWGTSTSTPTKGDVVVLARGSADGPQGHVGFFAGMENINGKDYVKILGGNQNDSVSVKTYPADRVLGYRKPPTNMDDAAKMVPALADNRTPQAETPVGGQPTQQTEQSAPNKSFAQNLLNKVFGSGGKSSGGSSSPQSSMESASAPALDTPSTPSLGAVLRPQRKMPPVIQKLKRFGEA